MSGFRLSQLLRLRKIEEDRAAADLSRRHSARRSREQSAHNMALRLGGMTTPSDTEATAFRAAVTARLARAGELSVARAALVQADAEVAAATDAWIAARGRVKSLDNLQERWQAEQRRAEQRAEQVAVDDLVTARWAGSDTATTGSEQITHPDAAENLKNSEHPVEVSGEPESHDVDGAR